MGKRKPKQEPPVPCDSATMNSFCASLSPQARCMLCSKAKACFWSVGDRTDYAQFTAKGIYIIREGFLVTSTLSEEGSVQGINFVGSGELSNLFAIYDAIDTKHDPHWRTNQFAMAVKESSACTVPASVFLDMMKASPSFSNMMLARVFDKLKSTIEYSGDFHEGTSAERIAALLSHLDRNGVRIGDLSHRKIGEILGLSRVSVTRALLSMGYGNYCDPQFSESVSADTDSGEKASFGIS